MCKQVSDQHSSQQLTGSDQCPYYTHIASFISPFMSTYCRLRPVPLLYPCSILYISIHVNSLQAPTSALIIPILHPSYLHSCQHSVGSDQCPYYTHIASFISPFMSTYCRLRPVPLLYPYSILHISIHVNIL